MMEKALMLVQDVERTSCQRRKDHRSDRVLTRDVTCESPVLSEDVRE